MTSFFRNAITNLLVLCISFAVAYAAIEIGYRSYEHHKLRNALIHAIASRVPNDGLGDSIFDVETGFRYRPNMEIGPRAKPFPVHYRTNSHGLIARDDFPVQKPANEFRIGFIGDSFTAGVLTTIRWTDVVEDRLNASPAWRNFTHGRHTRCINFGLDGIGTVQFAPVAENIAKPYGIDLLVVNMLKEDVIRRPYHRGFQTTITKRQIEAYADAAIAHLPWFEIYPEVIAVTMGSYFGLPPHLSYSEFSKSFWGDRLYNDPHEAAEASASSIHQILRDFPRTLFLLDPTYKEYTGVEDDLVARSFLALTKLVPSVRWIEMRDRLQKPADRSEIESWFNVPYDQHKNANGARAYGDAVADFLLEDLEENEGRNTTGYTQ